MLVVSSNLTVGYQNMTFQKGKPAWNSGKKGVQVPWNKGTIGAQTAWNKDKHVLGHKPSLETREKISASMKGRTGGYRPGSGVGKSGWYDGIWCDSTWELAFVIWCQTHGKHVERNTERFDYEFEGVKRKYLPDFIVDGQLIEIKGRRKTDPLIEAKLASTQGRVKMLLSDEMKPILESVKHLQPLEQLYGG